MKRLGIYRKCNEGKRMFVDVSTETVVDSEVDARVRELLDGEPERTSITVPGIVSHSRQETLVQVADDATAYEPFKMVGRTVEGYKYRRKR